MAMNLMRLHLKFAYPEKLPLAPFLDERNPQLLGTPICKTGRHATDYGFSFHQKGGEFSHLANLYGLKRRRMKKLFSRFS